MVDDKRIVKQYGGKDFVSIKSCLLRSIEGGLRGVVGRVRKGDIVCVEVPNRQIKDWLSGRYPVKYSDEYDSVKRLLDMLIIRHYITYSDRPKALDIEKTDSEWRVNNKIVSIDEISGWQED